MRFLATLLLWIVTTVALALVVPAGWLQTHIVEEDGYANLAASAAKDPHLQAAMASEIGTQLKKLVSGTGYDVSTDLLREAGASYTASSLFPGHFAEVNRVAHRWLFTDDVQQNESSDRWEVDLAPLLADTSFQQTLQQFGLYTPETLTVPVTASDTNGARPGQLRPLAQWGPWVSVGAVILTGLFALLTLAAARSRGTALAALGVSALLAGAAGWAALEVARRHVNDALNRTEGDIRQVADVMVNHAESSLHHWLNLTLAAGGALIVSGVIVSMLGGLRRKDDGMAVTAR